VAEATREEFVILRMSGREAIAVQEVLLKGLKGVYENAGTTDDYMTAGRVSEQLGITLLPLTAEGR
jgi:hypothetical protein